MRRYFPRLVLLFLLMPLVFARADDAAPRAEGAGRAIEYLKEAGLPDEVIDKITEAHKADLNLPEAPDQKASSDVGISVGNAPGFDLPALRAALKAVTEAAAGADMDPSVKALGKTASAFREVAKYISKFPGTASDVIASLTGDGTAAVFARSHEAAREGSLDKDTSTDDHAKEESRARIGAAVEYLAAKDAINTMAAAAIDQVITDEVHAAIAVLERQRADRQYESRKRAANAHAAEQRKYGEDFPDFTDADYYMITQKIETRREPLYSFYDRPLSELGVRENDDKDDYQKRKANDLKQYFYQALGSRDMAKAIQYGSELKSAFGDQVPAEEIDKAMAAANRRIFDDAVTREDLTDMIKAQQFGSTGIIPADLGVPMTELIKQATKIVLKEYQAAVDREDIDGIIKTYAFFQSGLGDPAKSPKIGGDENLDFIFTKKYLEAVERGDEGGIAKALAFSQTGFVSPKYMLKFPDENLMNILKARSATADEIAAAEGVMLQAADREQAEIMARAEKEVDRVSQEIVRASAAAAEVAQKGLGTATEELTELENKFEHDINAVNDVLDDVKPMVDDLPRAAEVFAEQRAESARRKSVGMFRSDPARERAYADETARSAREETRRYTSDQIKSHKETLRQWDASAQVAVEIRSDIVKGVGTLEKNLAQVASAASLLRQALWTPQPFKMLRSSGLASVQGAATAGSSRFSVEMIAERDSAASQWNDRIQHLLGDLLPPARDALKSWQGNGDGFRQFLRVLRQERSIAGDPSTWSKERVEQNISESESIPTDGAGVSLRTRTALDQINLSGPDAADVARKKVQGFLAEWEKIARIRDRAQAADQSWPSTEISPSDVEDIALQLGDELKTSRPWPESLRRWAQAAAGIRDAPLVQVQAKATIPAVVLPLPAVDSLDRTAPAVEPETAAHQPQSRPLDAAALTSSSSATRSRELSISEVQAGLSRLFSAYENENAHDFEEMTAADFRGADRSGFGYDAARFLQAMRDDFRSLGEIHFIAQVQSIRHHVEAGVVEVNITWQRRAKLEVAGVEWLAENRSSRLLFRWDEFSRAIKLSSIEGDPIFGISQPSGFPVIPKGDRIDTGSGPQLVINPIALYPSGVLGTQNPAATPPTLTAAVSPSSGIVPLTVAFTSSAQDPDGTVVSYRWDFGDASSSAEPNPSHVYTSVGNYTATVRVIDNDGAHSDATVSVSAVANQSPTVSISALPSSGSVPLTVNFTSTASDPDGSIASYAWDFGDGATSTSANPMHTYAFVGMYTATLTVRDNLGATASDARAISAASSDMHVSGTVTSDTVWSGNVFIDGSVTINAGVTATISSGATVSFTGNYFINVFGRLSASSAMIQGTGAAGSWQAISFGSGSTCDLSNNTIRDGGSAGSGLVALSSGVTILNFSGNTLQNSSFAALFYSGGTYTLTNNIFSNSASGIKIQGGSPTIDGGTISGNIDGVSLNSSGSIGTITLRNGITFTNNNDHIDDNVAFQSGVFDIRGCRFNSTTGGQAIEIVALTGPHTIDDNTFMGSFGDFVLNVRSSTITNNIFTSINLSGIGRDVIQTVGACGAISGNQIITPVNMGTGLNHNGSATSISNNIFNGNGIGSFGLDIRGNAPTISGNRISNFTFNGIRVVSVTVNLTGNNVENSTSFGVSGASAVINMDNNYLAGNNFAGVGVVDTSSTVPSSSSSPGQYSQVSSVTNPRSTPN